jgi:hypothetical protein
MPQGVNVALLHDDSNCRTFRASGISHEGVNKQPAGNAAGIGWFSAQALNGRYRVIGKASTGQPLILSFEFTPFTLRL